MATSGVFAGVTEDPKLDGDAGDANPAGDGDGDPLPDGDDDGDEPNPVGDEDDPKPAGDGADPNPDGAGAELKIDSDCELSGSEGSSPNGLSSVFMLGGAAAPPKPGASQSVLEDFAGALDQLAGAGGSGVLEPELDPLRLCNSSKFILGNALVAPLKSNCASGVAGAFIGSSSKAEPDDIPPAGLSSSPSSNGDEDLEPEAARGSSFRGSSNPLLFGAGSSLLGGFEAAAGAAAAGGAAASGFAALQPMSSLGSGQAFVWLSSISESAPPLSSLDSVMAATGCVLETPEDPEAALMSSSTLWMRL